MGSYFRGSAENFIVTFLWIESNHKSHENLNPSNFATHTVVCFSKSAFWSVLQRRLYKLNGSMLAKYFKIKGSLVTHRSTHCSKANRLGHTTCPLDRLNTGNTCVSFLFTISTSISKAVVHATAATVLAVPLFYSINP